MGAEDLVNPSRDHATSGDWRMALVQSGESSWPVSNVDERKSRPIVARCGEDQLPTHAYLGDGTDHSRQGILDFTVRKVMWENARRVSMATGRRFSP